MKGYAMELSKEERCSQLRELFTTKAQGKKLTTSFGEYTSVNEALDKISELVGRTIKSCEVNIDCLEGLGKEIMEKEE
jgi:hypothetical protein